MTTLFDAPATMPDTDENFDRANPGVYTLFVSLADQVRNTGRERYSSDAILHRIRWHFQIEQGNRQFKCNDHWTSYLARRLIRDRPDFKGFFELRRAAEDCR